MARPEHFGPFTATQVKEDFKAFDLDKNGYVGAAELRHVYASIREEVTDEEIDEMIRMVDRDGDGQITSNEFTKMVFTYAEQRDDDRGGKAKKGKKEEKEDKTETKEPQGISQAQSKQRKQIFQDHMEALEMKAVDAQEVLKQRWPKSAAHGAFVKNPNLGMPLFADLLHLEQTPKVQRLFSLFDLTEAGTVDIREFLLVLAGFAGWKADEKLTLCYDLFHMDETLKISRDDLVHVLKASYMAETTEQVHTKVEAIMRAADKHGSDGISKDDFAAVCRKFPNLLFPAF